ncbi:MAG: hypothetical protein ABMB14_33655 [Myxococcota bacterium]
MNGLGWVALAVVVAAFGGSCAPRCVGFDRVPSGATAFRVEDLGFDDASGGVFVDISDVNVVLTFDDGSVATYRKRAAYY